MSGQKQKKSQACPAGLSCYWRFRELALRIVRNQTDRAAEERWNSGNRHGLAAFQQFLQRFQRSACVESLRCAGFNDFNLGAAGLEDSIWTGSQKRVACPTLASFDAFEQKRISVPFQTLEER